MALLENPFTGRGSKQGQSTDPNAIQQQAPIQNGRGKEGESINDPGNLDGLDLDLDSPPKKGGKGNEVDENDPLTQLGSLWEDDRNTDGTPKQKKQQGSYIPDVDPKLLDETIGKMTFADVLTPEDMTAFAKGGEDSVRALPAMFDKVARKVFRQAFNASKRMAETGFQNAQTRFLETVPDTINTNLSRLDLARDNPLMSDPMFAPVVDSIRARVQQKFPKANSAEVNGYVKVYFDNMQKRMTTKAGGKGTDQNDEPDNSKKLRQGSADADWMDWVK